MELTYGSFTFDTTKLPETSVRALMVKGLNHYFGNEAASRVGSAIRQAIVEGTDRKAADVTTDEIKAYRLANPDAVAKLANETAGEFGKALLDGTVGARASSGATAVRDPFEAECRRLATIVAKDLVKSLRGSDGGMLKWPVKDETLDFGDGPLTAGQIIDLVLAGSKGEAIKKDATRNLAAQKKLTSGGVDASAGAKGIFG